MYIGQWHVWASGWAIWRLEWTGTRWSKVPYQAQAPQHHASSSASDTWATCNDAIAAIAAGHGDGISYVLTPDDPFAAADIDCVHDTKTGAVAEWAQRLLDQAGRSYAEVSPSGSGLRVWGLASGDKLHRNFRFDDGSALELFRSTAKILTATGHQIGDSRKLGKIDALLDRAWCGRSSGSTGSAGRVHGAIRQPLPAARRKYGL